MSSSYDKIEAVEIAVRRALVSVRSHADTVQVFATWVDEEGATHCYSRGEGNWHARMNQARTWVREEDAAGIHERIQGDD